MPFWRNYYHLVWATKKREHLIDHELEQHLYPILVSKAGELGMHVYAVNGWYDHVHLVGSIPPKLAVAEAVGQLKGASSRQMSFESAQPFGWQRGYGVFTLGQRRLRWVIRYVENQKEHHRNQTINKWLEEINHFDDGPTDGHLSTQDVLFQLQSKR